VAVAIYHTTALTAVSCLIGLSTKYFATVNYGIGCQKRVAFAENSYLGVNDSIDNSAEVVGEFTTVPKSAKSTTGRFIKLTVPKAYPFFLFTTATIFKFFSSQHETDWSSADLFQSQRIELCQTSRENYYRAGGVWQYCRVSKFCFSIAKQ
jgi:hypothetical protein